MQTKVSMVIPCYNKVNYIDDMFQSVYNQKWDNIELIIVNDGSTDGTREKISEWEPKFRERGYEIIITDQENKGVAAAIKNGLMQITGEYVCMPDCDDILNPHYVSRMAEVLDRDTSVEWVWCNIDKNSPLLKIRDKDQRLLLLLLLREHCYWGVYLRLIRTSYIKKCRVLEHFIETRITQEPQVMIPLAAGGAWPYIVCEKLYLYNTTVESSIRNVSKKNYENVITFWGNYKKIMYDTLDAYGLSSAENKCAVEIALLNVVKKDFDMIVLRKWQELAELASCIKTDKETLGILDEETAFDLLFDVAVDEPEHITEALKNAERIIFCCCLGKMGRLYIPKLTAIGLKPDVLWDAYANSINNNCHGFAVNAPDYSCLTKRDVVFILSAIEPIIYDVKREIDNKANVFTVYDIKKYIRWYCSEMFRKEDSHG